jgi:excisionase family DNA binding protein
MNEKETMNPLYSLNFQSATQPPAAPAVPSQPPANGSVGIFASATKSVPLVYTVEEAAAALNVSTKTIRRLLDRGILTASKALRKKLIPRSQIEGFLKATCDVPKSLK